MTPRQTSLAFGLILNRPGQKISLPPSIWPADKRGRIICPKWSPEVPPKKKSFSGVIKASPLTGLNLSAARASPPLAGDRFQASI